MLHNNLALMHLKLELYTGTLENTRLIADPKERSKGALYRGVQALYNLTRDQESLQPLEILVAKFPEVKVGQNELLQVGLRIAEETTGMFDFKKMYEASKLRSPLIDCGIYSAPEISQ
jgi:hypothetical protein